MIREIGDRLVLIGVAHILPKSREEVIESIGENEPEVVGVELCPARYFELTKKSGGGEVEMGTSGTSLLGKILKYFQEKIGEQTGMLPGEEMLTAVQKARETGAEIKLIDRDINFTLQRLLNEMSFWEKSKIFLGMLFSFLPGGGKFDLEDLTEEEVVEELISSFKEISESAYEVLIEERNEYMANQIVETLRSRGGKFLCVVGAGHIPGLAEKLQSRLKGESPSPWDNYRLEWKI